MTDAGGPELLRTWRASGLSKKDFWRANHAGAMSYNAMLGRMWRAENGLQATPAPYTIDLGKPWLLPDDDYIIVGDVQLPTTDYDFAALPLAIAREYMRRGHRNLVLAGDLLNADAFSLYDMDTETPAFEQEIEAAQVFFAEYLSVFDKIFYFMGNHERRIGKRTKAALKPQHILAMMTHDKRVQVSAWGHCVIASKGGTPYRVTHARNYSVNQLVVADQLAQKYQMHIIQHHEHHCAMGWDRYGRYVVINNGGLFRPDVMAYAVMDDSKSPAMKRGFTLLRGGTPYLFSDEPFTDWSAWLPERRAKRARHSADSRR